MQTQVRKMIPESDSFREKQTCRHVGEHLHGWRGFSEELTFELSSE